MTDEFERGAALAKDASPADQGLAPNGERSAGGPDASHAPGAVATLKQAMRRARLDNAERAGVLADQRMARLGRLEILQDELQPLVAQLPPEVDMFDIAIMPGANPRLFIDMIGFVEMGRDPKIYHLLQDTRHGRVLMAESEDVDTMVDAVTDYVARRLLERDKALAADMARADGARRANPSKANPPNPPRGDGAAKLPAVASLAARTEAVGGTSGLRHVERQSARGRSNRLMIAFSFLIDLLGSAAFFAILAGIGWYLWNRMRMPI